MTFLNLLNMIGGGLFESAPSLGLTQTLCASGDLDTRVVQQEAEIKKMSDSELRSRIIQDIRAAGGTPSGGFTYVCIDKFLERMVKDPDTALTIELLKKIDVNQPVDERLGVGNHLSFGDYSHILDNGVLVTKLPVNWGESLTVDILMGKLEELVKRLKLQELFHEALGDRYITRQNVKAIRFSKDVKGLDKVLIDAQAGGAVGDLAPDCTDIQTFRVAAPVGDQYGDYFVLSFDTNSGGYRLPNVKSKKELGDLIEAARSGAPDAVLFRVQNIIDAAQLDSYGNMPPSGRYLNRVPDFYLYANTNTKVKNEGEDILVSAGGS